MTRIQSLYVAALAALVLSPIAAAADSGWYAGVSAGAASQGDLEDQFPQDAVITSGDDFGFKLLAGYRLTHWLAFEANYADFGNARGRFDIVCIPEDPCTIANFEMDSRAWSVSALTGIDAGPVNVFARVGVSNWTTKARLVDFPDSDAKQRDASLLLGAGAEWRRRNLALRIEGERHRLEDSHVDLLSIGATWTFGN